MNQALYRKYRPKTFGDIVGQNIINQTIVRSIIENNVSHAYLFSGPRGTGKTSFAKILALTLNCYDNKAGECCGECNFCKNKQSQFLDIIEIDAASNNGVEEIRDLKSKINLMPVTGKYKVYIIDEVHMLSIGAFNALLKTLEEPPKHVIFILATTEFNKIPETIVSRCQKFDFKRISEKEIIERLQYVCDCENIKIKKEVLQKIALISNGGLRDALGLLDKIKSYSKKEVIDEEDLGDISHATPLDILENLIIQIENFNYEEYLNVISELENNGKDLIKLVEELILLLRDKYLNDISKEFYLSLIFEVNELLIKMKKSRYPKILLEMLIFQLKKDNKIKTKYDKIKKIRINNAFVNPIKSDLIALKEKWLGFVEINIKEIPILNKLTICVVSEKNIIFSIDDNIEINTIENIFKIVEDKLKDFLNKEYLIVILSNDEWEKSKEEYKKNKVNKVKYVYIKDILKGE